MDVSGQPHAPSALSLENNSGTHFKESYVGRKGVWMFWEEILSLSTAVIQTPDHPARRLSIPYRLL